MARKVAQMSPSMVPGFRTTTNSGWAFSVAPMQGVTNPMGSGILQVAVMEKELAENGRWAVTSTRDISYTAQMVESLRY